MRLNLTGMHRYLCLAFTVSAGALLSVAHAQNFNNRYLEASNRPIIKAKGESLYQDQNSCRIFTVNSARGPGATRDFQFTTLNTDGSFNSSYRFGQSGGDEFCHGFCPSQVTTGEFLICGESMFNNFLVMKVDVNGNLLWSKEIAFPGNFSEAITVLPTNNNPFDQGYMVFGNCGDHLAVVKLDENGNVMWKFEYSSNQPMEMTDVVVQHSINDRIATIVGNYDNSGNQNIFAFGIYTGTGAIFQQPYGYESNLEIRDPRITEVNSDMSAHIHELIITFEKSNGALTMPFQELGAVRLHGYYLNNFIWQYYYEPGQLWSVENQDIKRLSNGRFSILGEIHFWPFIMQINDAGNFGSVRSFIDVVTLPGTLTEDCGTGAELFNGQTVGTDELRVVRQDNTVSAASCTIDYTWPRQNLVFDAYDIDVTKTASGTISNYGTALEPVAITEVLDCSGNPAYAPLPPVIDRRTAIELEESFDNWSKTKNWFYPNPASTQVWLTPDNLAKTIAIYTLSGKQVFNTDYGQYNTLDLAGMAKGIYWIEKTRMDGSVQREKLIIQ